MHVQFTDADIQAKAIELGLVAPGDDVPRNLRSRVVAILLRQASGATAQQEQPEPQLAKEIVIQPGGMVLVDGEPFPWLIARTSMEISLDPDAVSTVRLTLLTDSVQIIKPEPRQESEQSQ